MYTMEILKRLSKDDVITLLGGIDDARRAESVQQFQYCFNNLKKLMMFDGALTIYSDKEALDRNEIPRFMHYNLDFSNDFLNQYTEARVFERSHVFQAVYKTWKPCHWNTAWSMKMHGNGDSGMRFAHSFGYLDGWLTALPYAKSSTFSLILIAGKKVENDPRTAAILTYLTPHLGESLKEAFHHNINQRREVKRIRLTPRELEILKWLSDGKSNWDISVILKRSQRVIKWHAQNFMEKLDAQNRTHAVAIALRRGLLK
jgi:DNA-binding CsgD family transcriptional regulator